MANTELTASALANIGCAVGNYYGFNACRVLCSYDLCTMQTRVEFTFGDARQMRERGLPRGWRDNSCALAYLEEENCLRNEISFELPQSVLVDSIDSVKAQLASKLIKLIPDGPAGVSEEYRLEQ
jgi:hypothetical protein